jgi:energy-coupling factor transport system permease protein
MMSTLGLVDRLASRGVTPWHHASAIAKLLLTAAIVGLAVASPSLTLLAVLYALVWALALTSRIPATLMLVASGYPLVFTSLFLIASWDGTWQTPARLLLRPLIASLTALWLVSTTSYPDLFAPISRLLPRSVGDGLFLTYRALFDLLARGEHLWSAVRLRGGASGSFKRRFDIAGDGVATLVLFGFERSQRQYATMMLRGHSGRICGCRHWAEWTRADLWVLASGVLIAAAALLLWRHA